jgi:hypothetical protein
MCGKTAYCGAFVGIVTLVLTVMLPWAAWGGPGPQALRVEKPSVLEGCPVMSDRELDSVRGRWDGYFFGLDINVNLAGGTLFNVCADPKSTGYTKDGTGDLKFNKTGGLVSGVKYNKGPVNYQAGIGNSSVYQTAMVHGTGVDLTGMVNLNITIPQSMQTLGRQGGPILCVPGGPPRPF